MMPEKQKYKISKGGKEKESLQKLLENQRDRGKTGNQKLLPYKMIAGTKNATVSEITHSYKKVIEWDTTFISWRKLSPHKMMTDFRAGCGC